jgi:multimeric flavodoxin WrbA
MQILVISGSRNRQGKTAQAINAVLKGFAKAGGNSESIYLPEMAIERCRQCNADGWGICRSEGRCIIEDDFASIVDKVKKADLVFFANPVYFGDLCESVRAFLDRYRRIRFRRPAPAQGAPASAPAPAASPMGGVGGIPAIGLCYAGGSGNGTITAVGSLERILQTGGFDIVDMIPVRRQNLEMKMPYLERVGEWLVTKPTSGPWPPPPAAPTGR